MQVRVLDNPAGVLTAAGLTLDDVVTTTVDLQDLNNFAKMNQVYATFCSLLLTAILPSQTARRDAAVADALSLLANLGTDSAARI